MNVALWLYRRMVALLPQSIRERDGEEMVRTFADQVNDSTHRSAVLWRGFTRMPACSYSNGATRCCCGACMHRTDQTTNRHGESTWTRSPA